MKQKYYFYSIAIIIVVISLSGIKASGAQSGTIITIAGHGGSSHVQTYNRYGETIYTSGFYAFAQTLTTGFNLASGDLNGDGVEEIIVAPKTGGAPHVRIFDNEGNLKFIPGFYAYGQSLRCGVDITTGDLDGDGKEEIVTIPGEGCPAHVRIFNYLGQPVLHPGFFAYATNLRSGFRISSGDLNNDGKDEIVTVPEKFLPAHVRIFDYQGNMKFTPGFYAYNNYKTGADIAVGDLDSDGWAEIITIPGKGYPAHLRIFNYVGELSLYPGFFAYSTNIRTGFSLAVGDLDGDNRAEIITAPQKDAPAHVRIFDYQGNMKFTPGFYAYNQELKIGADLAIAENFTKEDEELIEPNDQGSLIQPASLVYQGAFQLPAGDGSDEESWDWGGSAMAYYPDGDPTGPNDGYLGSIFGTGHEQYQYVSEITIPVPIISATKNLDELNTADTLQGFQDIRGEIVELPRVGLEYLADKLYYAWGQHMQEGDDGPSHGWFELDLSNPDKQGPWAIEGQDKYTTADYIFSIPESWTDIYTPNYLLATGRFRDGGQAGQGPSLIAYDGNPLALDVSLSNTSLLQYQTYYEDPDANNALNNYHHSDQWAGGAWLIKNNKSAVIFAGIKGIGDCWYGFSDGTVWPEEPPYPSEGPGERGWWSDSFQGQIIFYDPDDLAAVASGELEPYQPQPYAILNIDDILYYTPENEFRYLGGVSFDRENGILYIFEIRGDQETQRPLVHVWDIDS